MLRFAVPVLTLQPPVLQNNRKVPEASYNRRGSLPNLRRPSDISRPKACYLLNFAKNSLFFGGDQFAHDCAHHQSFQEVRSNSRLGGFRCGTDLAPAQNYPVFLRPVTARHSKLWRGWSGGPGATKSHANSLGRRRDRPTDHPGSPEDSRNHRSTQATGPRCKGRTEPRYATALPVIVQTPAEAISA
jgi:hypothetical protein